MKKFCEILKAGMHGKEITQKELAAERNVSQAAVSNWLTGKSVPNFDEAMEILSFLSVDTKSEIEKFKKNSL